MAITTGYPRAYPHPVLFVVDAVAVSTPEHPVLVVNLNSGVDAQPFRALPRQVQSIQNNLSLANMDYVEFAERYERPACGWCADMPMAVCRDIEQR